MDQNQMNQSSSDTGTRDSTYDLVAVLYHALQGVENTGIYLKDATQDQRQLLQMAHDTQRQIADQTKRLLHDALMREIQGSGSGQQQDGMSDMGGQSGGAFRFASSETQGGSNKFASQGNAGQGQMNQASGTSSDDEATRLAGHGVGSRLSNTEAATGGGGTSTF